MANPEREAGWLSPNEIRGLPPDPVAEFRSRFGWIGGKEIRGGYQYVSEIPLLEWRTDSSGDPERKGAVSLSGIGAVFNRHSLDLGGFRETIDQHAFDEVLDANPHVQLLRDHDVGQILGSTKANDPESLELRIVPAGLRFYSRLSAKSAQREYVQSLMTDMEEGMVRGASFAFTVGPGGDTWDIDEEENVTRTIKRIDALYDVTITAMGAYPQASSKIVSRSLLQEAIAQGRLPEITLERAIELAAPEKVDEPQDIAPQEGVSSPPLEAEDGEVSSALLHELQAQTKEAYRAEQERHLLTTREMFNEDHHSDRGGKETSR